MSIFNFSKKPSQVISLQHLRQLILAGSGRLRIVAAPDWSLTRADGSIPDAEDRKCYRQQGDTLYIGTDSGIGTNGGSVIGGNNITSINNSVIGSIVQHGQQDGGWHVHDR